MDEIKDKLIQELTPNILTLEIIEKEKLDTENLFELKIDSKVIGPFSGMFLKNFLSGKDLDNIMVKNWESIIWIPIGQHAFFYSGEVKPIAIPESERREFYLLINGRKIGPYKTEDIEYKFKNGELLFTDLISEDEGAHWCKLYEMAHVDLSKHLSTELPPTPSKIEESPSINSNVQDQIGIVGDLAKAGLEGEKEKAKRFVDLENTGNRKIKSSSPKILNRLILIGLLIAGFFYFTKKEIPKVEKETRAPTMAAPEKTIEKKLEIEKIPYRARPERKIQRAEISRPPRYPTPPAPELISTEPEVIMQDENIMEPEDDYLDEELPNPKKPASTRRRSRPKPFEDQVDEPIDEPIED